MLTMVRDKTTVGGLQELLKTLFTRRDELYAVAELLSDEDHSRICRRLADQLGGHAADLQQIILSNGDKPALPTSRKQAATRLDQVTAQGRSALAAAEQFEQDLRQRYDQTIAWMSDREIEGLLCKQRDEVEFGVCVLRSLRVLQKENEEAR